MGKGDKKVNIPLCAALILLTLTLITTHMTCGLYARYTSRATASDSARVAKFDVDYTVTENTDTAREGDFTLRVINKSEVAVQYYFVVGHSAPMEVSIADGTVQNTVDGSMTYRKFTHTGWVLAPGASSGEIPMQLTMTQWDGPLESLDSNTAKKTENFTLWVHAVQID